MPRPTHEPLTDQQVRSLKPGSIPIDVRDGEQRGLILTVLPSGRKQFTVRYRLRGKQKRLILGDYPGLSLAKARKRARHELTAIDGGADPAGALQTAKRAPTDTVEALAADYLKRHAAAKRTASEDTRILNVDVLPYWRERSVRELTRRDVRALLERVSDRGAPIMANRVLAVVRKMLNFAVEHDWIDANPAGLIKRPGEEASRERVLTDDEIRRVWRLLEHFPTTPEEKQAPGRARAKGTTDDPLCPISNAHAAILQLRLLTAQRGGEVSRMRWQDVDLKAGWWTIPAAHTKNKRAHRVPLTARALELIKAQVKDSDGETATEAVFSAAGSARDRAKKSPSVIARTLNLKDFRGHDLRRTAATKMGAAGIPRTHIAYVLNHADGTPRATQVYDRYEHDNEKRVALETWDRVLTGILENKPAYAIVPFVKGA
jgi:integrase